MTETCSKCHIKLTPEEIRVCDEGDVPYLSNNSEYRCKDHWCDCMPESTPWKWLNDCEICDHTICKTCKYLYEK